MKVDHLIRSYIANTGSNTLHGYIRYLHFVIQGLKRLKPNLALDVQTTQLQIDGKKQSILPDDYLKWDRVAILKADRLLTMVYDESILPPSFNNREPYNIDNSNTTFDSEWDFLTSFVKPDDVKQEFGKGEGYFMVDEEANVIQFDSRIDFDHCFLSYISNGFKPNTETYVHEFVADALIEYIRYMEAKYELGEGNPETQARRLEYLRRVDACNANQSNLHIDLIKDILNRSTTRAAIRNE